MVRIENESLIIEIKSNCPVEELENLQKALIDVIRQYDADGTDGMTLYSLGGLLGELIPSSEQNKVLYPDAKG